jgi:cytochrome c-type biogenesis protein CcmH/NrfG
VEVEPPKPPFGTPLLMTDEKPDSRKRLVSVALFKQLFVICIRLLVHIYVILELYSAEGQWNLPVTLQYVRFWFKNNPHGRVFARRHLEAGQNVAQSGLHLHHCEPRSCKQNKTCSSQELRNGALFSVTRIYFIR